MVDWVIPVLVQSSGINPASWKFIKTHSEAVRKDKQQNFQMYLLEKNVGSLESANSNKIVMTFNDSL